MAGAFPTLGTSPVWVFRPARGGGPGSSFFAPLRFYVGERGYRYPKVGPRRRSVLSVERPLVTK